MGAAAAVLSAEGAVGAVMLQIPVCEYLLRIRIEPPIQQVEVVGGFMDPKGTTAGHFSVPSSEIGCPVVNVQVPVKVHRGDFAYGVFLQQLFDFGHIGTPTVVETYDE